MPLQNDQGRQTITRILHQVPGRARIKVHGLYRCAPLKSFLEGRLSRIPGVLEARANVATGNLIISFQQEWDVQIVISRLTGILREFHFPRPDYPPPSFPEATATTTCTHPERKDSLLKSWLSAVSSSDHNQNRWHSMSAEAVLQQMETSPEVGLTDEAVRRRLLRFGPNAYHPLRPRSFMQVLTGQFRSLSSALVCFTRF